MNIKLDENLGSFGMSLLEAEGHDVMTIAEQQMSGAKAGAPQPPAAPRRGLPIYHSACFAPACATDVFVSFMALLRHGNRTSWISG